MTARLEAVAVLVLTVASCTPVRPRVEAGAQAGTASATAATTPHIDRIVPDSVAVPPGNVVEVSIMGRGFAPGQSGMNTIDFAGMPITSVPSNSAGTEIRFVIPTAIRSGGEAPPMPIHPGSYAVRVKTDLGTSNSVSIMVLP